MQLSIVTTLYKSAPFINEFYERITSSAKKITNDYEIIFVNDGSPDNSLELVLKLYERDNRIKVLDLSRNFGHHEAIMTGLRYSKGELVFLIDVDLEEEPETLELFYNNFDSDELDVVYGIQSKRQGSFIKGFGGFIFYKLFNVITSFPIPNNQMNVRLMSRRYVDSLLLHTEKEICLIGLWALTGYIQKPIKIDKKNRTDSSYSFTKRVSHAVTLLTSFSSKPLIIFFYLSILILLITFLFIIRALYVYLVYNKAFAGYTSIILSIWGFGGIILLNTSIIGIYIAKIFSEVKSRPKSIVREFYEK